MNVYTLSLAFWMDEIYNKPEGYAKLLLKKFELFLLTNLFTGITSKQSILLKLIQI